MARARRLGIKHCGTCNPSIDPGVVAQAARSSAQALGMKVVSASEGALDAVLIINACEQACADREDVRALAPRSLVVTSELVGAAQASGQELVRAVQDWIRSLVEEDRRGSREKGRV